MAAVGGTSVSSRYSSSKFPGRVAGVERSEPPVHRVFRGLAALDPGHPYVTRPKLGTTEIGIPSGASLPGAIYILRAFVFLRAVSAGFSEFGKKTRLGQGIGLRAFRALPEGGSPAPQCAVNAPIELSKPATRWRVS